MVAVIALFLRGGCRRPDTDVTLSPEYNFAPFAGTVWKTKVKMALADITGYTGRHEVTVVPPRHFDPTHPQYQPLAKMQMIAELPIGTRVRVERLMKDNGSWGGVQVTASLEDGKVVYLLRRLLAKNQFMWPGWSDSTDWGMDPDLLEK
jgi:hypothetical protein